MLYLDYEKYKLFDVSKFFLVPPAFQLIQQPSTRTRYQMKSLHFNILHFRAFIKSNLTKSYARRLKSSKYKTPDESYQKHSDPFSLPTTTFNLTLLSESSNQ